MWPVKNLSFDTEYHLNDGLGAYSLLHDTLRTWVDGVYGWPGVSYLATFLKIINIARLFVTPWLSPKRRLLLAVFFDQLAISRYRSVIKPFD